MLSQLINDEYHSKEIEVNLKIIIKKFKTVVNKPNFSENVIRYLDDNNGKYFLL